MNKSKCVSYATGLFLILIFSFGLKISSVSAYTVSGTMSWSCSPGTLCTSAQNHGLNTSGSIPFSFNKNVGDSDYTAWANANGACALIYVIWGAMPIGCSGGGATAYGPGDPVPQYVLSVGWLGWDFSVYYQGSWATGYFSWTGSFKPANYNLGVTATNCSVSSVPAGISNCSNGGGTCSASFAGGTSVGLTATPNSGYSAATWSGDCNSSGGVVIDGNKSCTATCAVLNCSGFSVSPASFNFTVGQTGQINYSGQTGAVTFSSDNTLVATVNSSGLVTAVGGGSANINVMNGGCPSKTIPVTVNAVSCPQSCGDCSVSACGQTGTQTCVRLDCLTYSQSCSTQPCVTCNLSISPSAILAPGTYWLTASGYNGSASSLAWSGSGNCSAGTGGATVQAICGSGSGTISVQDSSGCTASINTSGAAISCNYNMGGPNSCFVGDTIPFHASTWCNYTQSCGAQTCWSTNYSTFSASDLSKVSISGPTYTYCGSIGCDPYHEDVFCKAMGDVTINGSDGSETVQQIVHVQDATMAANPSVVSAAQTDTKTTNISTQSFNGFSANLLNYQVSGRPPAVGTTLSNLSDVGRSYSILVGVSTSGKFGSFVNSYMGNGAWDPSNSSDPTYLGDSNVGVIDSNSASQQGTMAWIQYWAQSAQPLYFFLVDGANKVQWVSPLVSPSPGSINTYTPLDTVNIQPGWSIGVYPTGQTIMYVENGSSRLMPSVMPSGATFSFSPATVNLPANGAAGPVLTIKTSNTPVGAYDLSAFSSYDTGSLCSFRGDCPVLPRAANFTLAVGVPATHKACVSNACVVVSGAGSDACTVNGDCVSPSVDIRVSGHGLSQVKSVQIAEGESVNIDWTSTNVSVNGCTTSGGSTGWPGSNRPAQDQTAAYTYTPAAGLYTYTIQCQGPGGTSNTDSAQVEVITPALKVLTVGIGDKSCTAVTINWAWNDPWFDSQFQYRVLRSEDNVAFSQRGPLINAPPMKYTDNDTFGSDKTYYYRVEALRPRLSVMSQNTVQPVPCPTLPHWQEVIPR